MAMARTDRVPALRLSQRRFRMHCSAGVFRRAEALERDVEHGNEDKEAQRLT